MAWTTWPAVTTARQRWPAADLAVETLDGFRRHQSGRSAAMIAYYGFFTLFPLLMAATTVLGFFLEDDPGLQQDIVDSALAQIPVIGPEIQRNAGHIDGNWWALAVGLVVATWGSLKAFVGVQSAFDDCWDVDVDHRANAVRQRLKALVGVMVIGVGQVGNVALAAIVDEAGLPRLSQVLITLGGLAVNVAILLAMYRVLASRPLSWRQVWPGAIAAGVAYTVLQFAGTAIMTRTFDNAVSVYGTFAATLALLTWLSLHALISLIGCELNAAVDRRRLRAAAPPTVPVPAAGDA